MYETRTSLVEIILTIHSLKLSALTRGAGFHRPTMDPSAWNSTQGSSAWVDQSPSGVTFTCVRSVAPPLAPPAPPALPAPPAPAAIPVQGRKIIHFFCST